MRDGLTIAGTDRMMREACGGLLSEPDKFAINGVRFAGAWGLPARVTCPTGSKLAENSASPCAACYGVKGRYGCRNVKHAQDTRLRALESACDAGEGSIAWNAWINAFADSVLAHGFRLFRFHDTGDVYRAEYASLIIAVVERCPDVTFWLPTQEHSLWRKLAAQGRVPANLIVRYSARRVDFFCADHVDAIARADAGGEVWSGVQRDAVAPRGAVVCSCGVRGNCGHCRACWNPRVAVVLYPIH